MNRIARFLLACSLLPMAGIAQTADSAATASPEESAASKPRIAQGLIPSELQAGLQIGWQASRFRASTDYRSLIEPTTAEEDPFQAMSWGFVFAARWRSGISLTLAPRGETYGMRTQEETVTFNGNPFPHQMKSNTEANYTVWPLLAGMGWFTSRQHAQVQVGPYAALYQDGKVEWTVDGEPYYNHPQPIFRDEVTGWMLTTEYGYRLGRGEVTLGLETQRANESAMTGLKGSIRPEAAMVRMSYVYSLMKR